MKGILSRHISIHHLVKRAAHPQGSVILMLSAQLNQLPANGQTAVETFQPQIILVGLPDLAIS